MKKQVSGRMCDRGRWLPRGRLTRARRGAAAQGRRRCGPQTAQTKAAQDLIAQAMAIAKDDLKAEATDACLPGGPARDPDPRPMQKVETAQGLRQPLLRRLRAGGHWTLDTGAGLILFDTLNNPQEAEEVLVPGLKQLGLDPANIKFIVLSHGHADHFGGAPYFQEHYNTPGDDDRGGLGSHRASAARKRQRARRATRVLPKRDKSHQRRRHADAGEHNDQVRHLPGHTPGTIMFSAPVLDHGVRRVCWLSPPAALQVPNKRVVGWRSSTSSTTTSRRTQPEMVFNSHPLTMNDGLAKMAEIRKNPNGPNPVRPRKAKTARYLDIMLRLPAGVVVEKRSIRALMRADALAALIIAAVPAIAVRADRAVDPAIRDDRARSRGGDCRQRVGRLRRWRDGRHASGSAQRRRGRRASSPGTTPAGSRSGCGDSAPAGVDADSGDRGRWHRHLRGRRYTGHVERSERRAAGSCTRSSAKYDLNGDGGVDPRVWNRPHRRGARAGQRRGRGLCRRRHDRDRSAARRCVCRHVQPPVGRAGGATGLERPPSIARRPSR